MDSVYPNTNKFQVKRGTSRLDLSVAKGTTMIAMQMLKLHAKFGLNMYQKKRMNFTFKKAPIGLEFLIAIVTTVRVAIQVFLIYFKKRCVKLSNFNSCYNKSYNFYSKLTAT